MASEAEMTTVFVVEDLVQKALLESVLREADVPYLIRNAGVQNLFGVGQIGGFNLATGPEEIQVPSAEFERARELIVAALGDSAVEDSILEEELEESKPDEEAHAEAQPDELAARYSHYSVVWAVLWLGGVGSLLAIYFGVLALDLLRGSPVAVKSKPLFGVTYGGMGLVVWLFFWWTMLRH
jgi:hypothetical protein